MPDWPPKLRKQVVRELTQNPAWRFAVGLDWICPYCGEAATRQPVRGETAEDAAAARALEHLERCRAFREFQGETLSIAELSARAMALKVRDAVRRHLTASASWQLYDVTRRWWCPFCAQATEARLPEDRNRITAQVVREIERHLLACHGFDKGRGKERSEAHLRSVVAYANRTRRMADQIRRKIESDPQWRSRDPAGRWLCPYCRQPVEAVDLSSKALLADSAPIQISKHLVASCERFRTGAGARPKGAPAAPAARRRSNGLPLPPEEGRGEGGPDFMDSAFDLDPVASATSAELARLVAATSGELTSLDGGPPVAASGVFDRAALVPPPALPEPPPPPSPEEARAALREAMRKELESVESAMREPSETGAPAGSAGSGRFEGAGVAASGVIRPGAGTAGVPAPYAYAFSPPPEVDGVEVRTLVRIAREPPSSFCDFIPHDERFTGMLVGSIAGAGGPGAELVVPMVRHLFRIHSKGRRPPGEVLRLVNQDLFAELDGKTFVATTYGLLDARAPAFRFARAGTNPPVLLSDRRDPPLRTLEAGGMVMGIDRGAVFDAVLEEREVGLAPGDLIAQFTYGVVAAPNPSREELGLERLHRLIERYGRHESEYLCVKVGQHLDDWMRGADREEDCVLLAVKIK